MSDSVPTPQGSDQELGPIGSGAPPAEVPITQFENTSEFNGLSPVPDRQLEQLLADAKAENTRLKREQELAKLQAQNRTLRESDSPATAVGTTAAAGMSSPIIGVLPKAKTMRPETMRPYKGLSEGEHTRWFRDAEIQFVVAPEYFLTDQAKVGYCMKSLEDDPNVQWYGYFSSHGLEGVTFDFFKKFLLNLVADPVNRRLAAYERWESARQRDMKVSAFKASLEEIEAHLPPFSEEHRANFFLAKLKPELKNKILSTGNVPKLREEILAMAIMQENILDRSRSGGGSNQNSAKNSSGSKNGKPHDDSNSGSRSTKGGGDAPPRSSGTGSKRNADSQEDRSNDVCRHCGKKGHWRPDCPDRDKPQTYVAAVEAPSKNEEAPPTPLKRSKPNSKSNPTSQS